MNLRSPRSLRAAKRRLRYRDTDMRLCTSSTCPCYAAVGDTLCSAHRYEADAQAVPPLWPFEPETPRLLPFDEETR